MGDDRRDGTLLTIGTHGSPHFQAGSAGAPDESARQGFNHSSEIKLAVAGSGRAGENRSSAPDFSAAPANRAFLAGDGHAPSSRSHVVPAGSKPGD